ncbi:toprim domain-containing protein, partial [Parabacteroides merdae]|uniref:toprim domain-containing protein n=1 Tax=Parabacteroides merdae TaxID=46503 RepID=UPI0021AB7CB2
AATGGGNVLCSTLISIKTKAWLYSFGKQSFSEPSFQELDIVQLTSPALLAYLQERGINTALAKRECKEARFTHNGKRYFAIAFPNISGGYEIRNRYFKGCIAPKEISHIRQSGKPRSACYVFEGFMDYLSFLTLRLESCPQSPDFDRQDYIVLNSVANVPKALYPLGSYERIHCFFDNDRAGMEAIQQIRKEYDATRYIRDASQIYSGCKDLNEYLQKRIADRKEQAQSVKKRNDTLSKKPKGFRL